MAGMTQKRALKALFSLWSLDKTLVLIIPGKDLDILKDSSTFLQDVGCKGANTNSIFKIVTGLDTGLTNDVQQ